MATPLLSRDSAHVCVGLQARMEPLGIIVFSCIMGTAGFSVILEAVRQLIDHAKTELPYEGAVIGALLGRLRAPVPMPRTCAPALCTGRLPRVRLACLSYWRLCATFIGHTKMELPSVGIVVCESTSHPTTKTSPCRRYYCSWHCLD